MTNYRRQYRRGGTYFFTLTLAERRADWLVRHIDLLRTSIRSEKLAHPFRLAAWVVLPGHMHVLMRLPEGDGDFSNRLRRIKAGFSRALPILNQTSASQLSKGERGIWQRRFWEHVIRDEHDWQRHFDYIHYNPVKHGLVSRVSDWPHSSFKAHVARGTYPPDWAGSDEISQELSAGEY